VVPSAERDEPTTVGREGTSVVGPEDPAVRRDEAPVARQGRPAPPDPDPVGAEFGFESG
jgi:hypothetical protein